MGYRSDVSILTTKEGWAKIDQAVREVEGITEENQDSLFWLTDETHTTELGGGAFVLAEWEDIKWYEETFSDVGAVMATLAQFRKDGTPYQYIRVGEDYEDNESYYSNDLGPQGMPRLQLVRKIEVTY